MLYLLDRDGVLNVDVGSPGVVDVANLRLLEGAAEAVASMKKAGHRTAMVTNQSCIRKGLATREDIDAINEELRRLLSAADGAAQVDAVFVAEGVDACPYRLKPEPDLLLAAMDHMGIPVSRSVLIGDSKTDIWAAARAGLPRAALVLSSHHGKSFFAELRECGALTEYLPSNDRGEGAESLIASGPVVCPSGSSIELAVFLDIEAAARALPLLPPAGCLPLAVRSGRRK